MTFGQSVALFIAAAIGILLVNFANDAQIKQKSNYCEMVEIYKDSGGEFGWPDFRNNYERDCK